MTPEPSRNCPLCPRLVAFRKDARAKEPNWFNSPVPSFGPVTARLLIVGLAPGMHGANRTGRPFTGDYAGDILYASLLKSGFARGSYSSPRGVAISGEYKDNLQLANCRITNAVRCVPQENKPEPSEIKNCNDFLKAEIHAMPNLKLIVSLGLVSHNAVLKALGHKAAHLVGTVLQNIGILQVERLICHPT
jgi:uracil-DNA glycosylase